MSCMDAAVFKQLSSQIAVVGPAGHNRIFNSCIHSSIKGVRCRRENEISVKELGIVVFHHKDTNLSVVVKTTCFYHSDIEGDS